MEEKGKARMLRSAAYAIVPALFFLTPAAAQAPALAALDKIERGEWELRFRDGSAARKICVRTGREFIQLRHAGAGCSRYVVEDGANSVTVQYTCPNNGYGLTTIRMETRSLVQVKGSGLANARPFEFTAEARRTGSCR